MSPQEVFSPVHKGPGERSLGPDVSSRRRAFAVTKTRIQPPQGRGREPLVFERKRSRKPAHCSLANLEGLKIPLVAWPENLRFELAGRFHFLHLPKFRKMESFAQGRRADRIFA